MSRSGTQIEVDPYTAALKAKTIFLIGIAACSLLPVDQNFDGQVIAIP
jgi:hypothetical protein